MTNYQVVTELFDWLAVRDMKNKIKSFKQVFEDSIEQGKDNLFYFNELYRIKTLDSKTYTKLKNLENSCAAICKKGIVICDQLLESDKNSKELIKAYWQQIYPIFQDIKFYDSQVTAIILEYKHKHPNLKY